MTRKLLTCVLAGLIASAVVAETVRGPVVDIVTIGPDDNKSGQIELALDEILGVTLSADTRFLEGVEIAVDVPASIRSYPGSVAVLGLASVTPKPTRGVMGFRGAQVLFEPLLQAQHLYYQIPLVPDASLRDTAATTVVDRVVPADSFPLLLTFSEISKGGTIDRDSTRFHVEVRAITADHGAVAFQFVTEDGERLYHGDEELAAVRLRIDGESVPAGREIVLPTGLHELHLQSDVFLEASRTFGVERGRVSEIVVTLERPKATVRLDAPRGAAVFVDGSRISDGVVELSEGEHVALVRIGDYSVSRRFTVTRKKRYIISVSLDIIVNELE
jgi:hypothetical protein